MFKPMILASAMLTTILFLHMFMQHEVQVHKQVEISPQSVILNCKPAKIFYIDTIAGIWIGPEDLATFSASSGCTITNKKVIFSLIESDSINFGCNSAFMGTPLSITVKVSDSCGDTKTCTSVVTIRDTFPPDIKCPKDTVVCAINNAPPVLTNTVDFEEEGGILLDNCFPPSSNAFSYLLDTINATCGKTITRQYKIIDFVGLKDSCVHRIHIPDTLKLTCPAAVVQLYTNGTVCQDTFIPTKPIAHSSCGLLTLNHNGPLNNIYPIGTRTITWTATNRCGDSASCSVQVKVNDIQAPNLVCKPVGPIALSINTQNILPSSAFVTSAIDGCSIMVHDSVRRMDIACNPNANKFEKSVAFCCADVNKTISVVVKASDEYGNSNTCMVNVFVDDKLPPSITPLRNISVSCNYFINLNNLSPFGSIRTNPAQVQIINLDDPIFDALPGMFQDGLATDFCAIGMTVTSTHMDMRDAHNTGNIIRKFVVTDARGNSSTSQQIITVTDTDSLQLSHISWPKDTTYTGCSPLIPTPAMTGSPTIPYDDVCTIIGISHKDLVFDDPNSGCKYIMRTWKVIDWAKYVPNTTKGVFTNVQDIHQINTTKPIIISSCTNVNQCAPNADCNATFKYRIKATDDCTDSTDIVYKYSININNDGGTPEIIRDGRDISQLLERGTHLITVMAEDRCGNLQQCLFTVTIKECKAPNAVMLNGLSTDIGNDKTVTIWAVDFNNYSSDNCTPSNQLRYSFSAIDPNQIGHTFDCGDLGNQPVSIYVYDLDGNITKVNTFIHVSDNFNRCSTNNNGGGTGGNKIHIAGKIATENSLSIPDTKISVTDGTNKVEVITDDNGNYKVDDLNMYNNYYVVPERNKDWINGVSTLDMVKIQRHILQIEKLDNPYKLIAADINNDNKISARDLVDIRKLLLGNITEVANGKSWRFVDAAYQFSNPENPWPVDEIMRYENLEVNMSSSNFIAIKSGDVNGSAAASIGSMSIEPRSEHELTLSIEDVPFEIGKVVNVPITSKNDLNMEGLQMSMAFDDNVLEFIGIIPEAISLSNDEYFLINNGSSSRINVAKAESTGWEVQKDRVLFTLQFRAKKASKLSNNLTLDKERINAVAYAIDDTKYHLDLEYRSENELLEVWQNNPNPFSESSQIKFKLNADSPVEITVYNNLGSKIFSKYIHFTAGVHNLTLGNEMLGMASGIFYVHIETAEMTEIIKALRIQ